MLINLKAGQYRTATEITMTMRNKAILKQREALLRRREAIVRALSGDLEMLRELKQQASGDVVDIACDSAQDEISSQLVEVESRELAQIDKALHRMEDGSYGACEQCGAAIPVSRLNALPYATLCVRCQEKSEDGEIIESGPAQIMDWSALADPLDNLTLS